MHYRKLKILDQTDQTDQIEYERVGARTVKHAKLSISSFDQSQTIISARDASTSENIHCMCACVIVLILLSWGNGFLRESSCSVTRWHGESVAKRLPSDTRQWASIRDKGTQCCEAFWPEIWESSAPFGCILKWTSISIQLTTYYQTKQPPRCEDSNLDYGASSSCWCCLVPPAHAQMISKCFHAQRR